MLLQLTSNQISSHWDEIKDHLQYTLSPIMEISEATLNNIFEGLIAGTSQAWIIIGDAPEHSIYAMAVTSFSYEPGTNTKNLLIYSLSGYRHIPDELWKSALDGAKAFAKANGCFKLMAYTQVDRITAISNSVGGNTNTRLIYWEV